MSNEEVKDSFLLPHKRLASSSSSIDSSSDYAKQIN
jgi:hypothetical protein